MQSGIILLSLIAELKKPYNKNGICSGKKKQPCTASPAKRQKPAAIKKMSINTRLHVPHAILILSLAITGFTLAFRISCQPVYRLEFLLSLTLWPFLLIFSHWENPVASFSIRPAVNCCSYSGKKNPADSV